jgi:hypothetical protein
MSEKLGSFNKMPQQGKEPEKLEDEVDQGSIDRNTMLRARTSSPEVAAAFYKLQDPSMPLEMFFDEIGKYNDMATQPREGSYRQINTNIGSNGRSLSMKVFSNGRVTLSGSEHPRGNAETREGVFSMPHAGETVRMTKRGVIEGNTSAVPAGESSSGKLSGDIQLGQNIELDNGARTSPIRSMRVEGNIVVVETNTSVYEITRG